MITSLAGKRIRYNKSRTLLTVIAITLTTMLLMALGTSAVGLLDFNKQQAAATTNAHATVKGLTHQQVEKLSNHADVESLKTNEIFATIDYDRMNGYLTYTDEIKDVSCRGSEIWWKGTRPKKQMKSSEAGRSSRGWMWSRRWEIPSAFLSEFREKGKY